MPRDDHSSDAEAGRAFHAPPAIPTEVRCLRCGEEYESYLIEYRVDPRGPRGRPWGYWACPTPGCDGKGFGFDLLPIDFDDVGEDGARAWDDGGDEDECDGDEAFSTSADDGPRLPDGRAPRFTFDEEFNEDDIPF